MHLIRRKIFPDKNSCGFYTRVQKTVHVTIIVVTGVTVKIVMLLNTGDRNAESSRRLRAVK